MVFRKNHLNDHLDRERTEKGAGEEITFQEKRLAEGKSELFELLRVLLVLLLGQTPEKQAWQTQGCQICPALFEGHNRCRSRRETLG